MKSWETVRGRQAVDHIHAKGRRLEAGMIRCLYLVTSEHPSVGRVIFAVPSRVFNAVRRNRIKRLMRVAFDREWPALHTCLERSRCSLSLLLIFRGKKGLRVPMLRLDAVHGDVAALCSNLRATL